MPGEQSLIEAAPDHAGFRFLRNADLLRLVNVLAGHARDGGACGWQAALLRNDFRTAFLANLAPLLLVGASPAPRRWVYLVADLTRKYGISMSQQNASTLAHLIAIRAYMEAMIAETARTLAAAVEKDDTGIIFDLRKKLVALEGELMSFERLIAHFTTASDKGC